MKNTQKLLSQRPLAVPTVLCGCSSPGIPLHGPALRQACEQCVRGGPLLFAILFFCQLHHIPRQGRPQAGPRPVRNGATRCVLIALVPPHPSCSCVARGIQEEVLLWAGEKRGCLDNGPLCVVEAHHPHAAEHLLPALKRNTLLVADFWRPSKAVRWRRAFFREQVLTGASGVGARLKAAGSSWWEKDVVAPYFPFMEKGGLGWEDRPLLLFFRGGIDRKRVRDPALGRVHTHTLWRQKGGGSSDTLRHNKGFRISVDDYRVVDLQSVLKLKP